MCPAITQTAFITGASSGIGRSLAELLHKQGWNVVIVARRKEILNEMASNFNKTREGSARFKVADLTSNEDVFSLENEIKKSQCDLLINNAGVGSFGYLEQLPLEREVSLITLNCIAPLRLTHAVLTQMKSRRSGSIINISSLAGIQAVPYMSTYSGTKAFDFSFSMALRHEVKKFGIKVLTVCPGPVDTEFGGVARMPGEATGISRDTSLIVADHILKSLKRNQALSVPGWSAKPLYFLIKVLPTRLKFSLIEVLLRRVISRL